MRRLMKTALVAFALCALGAAATAAGKADFTGTWVLDLNKSEGLWPGTEQTLTVKQTAERIEIEVKVKTPQGERVVKDSYTPDGKEVEFAPPGAVGKGRRTVKWTADGGGIEITEFYDAQMPEGVDTMKSWRRWTLSADGRQLIIEQNAQTPNGLSQTKRVFVKQ